MPVEVRKVIFSKSETGVVLSNFYRKAGLKVPEGSLHEIEVLTETPFEAAIKYEAGNSPQLHVIRLNSEQIVEALVTACIDIGIPLPRRGKKFVSKQKEGLSLSISIQQMAIT